MHTVGLVPVHPATEGISAERLRSLVWDDYGRIRHAVEPLPAALRAAERLPDRPAALAAAHFPDSEEEEQGARRRLAFEELLLLQLAVAGAGAAPRGAPGAAAGAARVAGRCAGAGSLPFELTGDQLRACAADRRATSPPSGRCSGC